jgi:hypothetical protein
MASSIASIRVIAAPRIRPLGLLQVERVEAFGEPDCRPGP